jgi:hypothetical protein
VRTAKRTTKTRKRLDTRAIANELRGQSAFFPAPAVIDTELDQPEHQRNTGAARSDAPERAGVSPGLLHPLPAGRGDHSSVRPDGTSSAPDAATSPAAAVSISDAVSEHPSPALALARTATSHPLAQSVADATASVESPVDSSTGPLRGPTPVRTPRTPARANRRITRYAFEFFQDQIDTLHAWSLREKLLGERGSMSEMVRDALDAFIAAREQPVREDGEVA